jgi:hypothetical protein
MIYGLTLANNGADDIDVDVGKAVNSTNAYVMSLGSKITKQLDAAWEVGTNKGGLDTGSVADATYHVFLIARSDTGVVDALFSTSASSPSMPASYDYKRRIGSIVRSGGANKGFSQRGDEFLLNTPVNDVNTNTPGASAVTATLSVPSGVQVVAYTHWSVVSASRVTEAPNLLVTSLDQSDTAPSATVFTAKVDGNAAADEQGEGGASAYVRTNTSSQVRYRVGPSGGSSVTVSCTTQGWIDSRGQDG